MTARRLVVVGDTLLDSDVDGSVTRIAPDAPVPVLDETTATDRPGGAGLAALLAVGQGYDVVLITALAHDASAARLTEMMTAAGVIVYGLTCAGATAQKIRMRAAGRVLLRLDRGGPGDELPGEPPEAALAEVAGAAAVLVSDYGRGVARQPALRVALANTPAPVVWDPHPRGPAAVPGARLVTPNERELRGLTGGSEGGRLGAVARGAEELRRRWRSGAVAVTLGADGALLAHAAPTPLVVPVSVPSSGDTCGAGDRFAAAAAVALANGVLVSEAVETAVEQAAAYVAAGGVGATRVGALTGSTRPISGFTTSAPGGTASATRSGTTNGSGTGTVAGKGTGNGNGPGFGTSHTTGTGATGNGATGNGATGNGTGNGRISKIGMGLAGNGGPGAVPADGAGRTRNSHGPGNGHRLTTSSGPVRQMPARIGAETVGALVAGVRARGGTVVASGGCFDLLHAGHIATLEAARRLGDCLIVCVNSDASVRALKGPNRPLVNETDRARLLDALSCVDAVMVFDETTPHAVLSWLRPDVWVKGGDYSGGAEDQPDLPEAELVARWGGQTVVVPYLDGRSTTRMIAAARSGGGQQRGVEVG